ncbi:glycoside hydrolase family 27 protein [Cylindrobasidium torrendii FP15055 ss-10]|uniref:Alpha-galactosidase n=1 Tax=Cylindrobasidium torrendii FP15055 ss-10 TaxID=1314674 RepID=A0A0D7BV96_9AGAR|nr:glycoside hydrolase family 27 protein [Cylindrobasidium torrendii FP15055 ss-10]
MLLPHSPLVLLLAFLSCFAPVWANSPYGQCGGSGWSGDTTCPSGSKPTAANSYTCVDSSEWYSQCLQATSTSAGMPSTAATSGVSSTSTTASTYTSTSAGTGASSTSISSSTPTDAPSKLTGKTPALGWNHWNAYGCAVSEEKVLAAANSLVDLGLKDAGYEYVNIDDCWDLQARDSSGHMVPDPTKFPNGIKAVADKIHDLGLKIGIYSDAGSATCADFPGSLDGESVDAALWAEWGIDYLKYDNCNVPGNWSDYWTYTDWYESNSAKRYRQMAGALANQDRPIQFALCNWGNANVWDWGARVGHSWRMSGDSSATWLYFMSIISTNVNHLDAIDFYAHNDMDMMEIGNGNFTVEEERTHFAAWAFLKSPILFIYDECLFQLSTLTTEQVGILKNAELLAFSQDTTVGAPAKPFTAYSGAPTTTPPEYYAGQSSAGTHVFIINTSASAATKAFTLSAVPSLGTGGSFKIHDMWTGKDLSGSYAATANFTVSLAAHDTAAYLITTA